MPKVPNMMITYESFSLLLSNIRSYLTNNSIKPSKDAKGEISCYIDKWISKYIKDRENEKLATPLKNYGEKDEALISRVRASTRESEEVVQIILMVIICL